MFFNQNRAPLFAGHKECQHENNGIADRRQQQHIERQKHSFCLGKAVVVYPAMAAKLCKLTTMFYVSSDDVKILDAATDRGYVKIRRLDELALATAQHIGVIKHALNRIKAIKREIPNILVVLLANSGIVKTKWIEKSINEHLEDEALSPSSPVILKMDNHPHHSKRFRGDGYLEPWSDFKGQGVSTNRQDLPVNYVLCHNIWTLRLSNSLYSENEGQQP